MLVETLHVNSECNMVSEAVPVSRLTIGKAENSNQNQNDKHPCQDQEARNGTLEFNGTTTNHLSEPSGREDVAGIPHGTTEDNLNVNPLFDNACK